MAVYGDRLYVGEADSMEVRVHDAKGTLLQVMRVPGFDLSLTRAELIEEREALVPERAPAVIRDALANMPDPDTKVAYSDLLVDPEGFVWAVEAVGFVERERPKEARIFAPGGEWLGSVLLPERFTAFEVGRDYVLGVRRDELDVERVQVLPLERGAAPGP